MPNVYTSGSTSDDIKKDTFHVTIINIPSAQSESQSNILPMCKIYFQVPIQENMPIEPLSVYPKPAPSTIMIEPPSRYPTGDHRTITAKFIILESNSGPYYNPSFDTNYDPNHHPKK